MKNTQQKNAGLLLIILFISAVSISTAQDTSSPKKDRVLYTGMLNIAPDKFNVPLVGFVNIAKGSQHNTHIGFLNTTQQEFSGAQIGFLNIAGGKVIGTQIGFLNIAGGDAKGTQVGFMNTTKTLKGLQLGFFNYAESAENGVPVGFFSFVKKGGYRAIKISMNELYPMNLAFDIGVKKFYTSIVGSYNQGLKNQFAVGFGIGSIIDINRNIYFNPELITQDTEIGNVSNNRILSLRPQLGVKLFSNIDILCGPSLVWQNATGQSELNKPFYSLFKNTPDSRNNLIGGANISLKLHLNKRMSGLR